MIPSNIRNISRNQPRRGLRKNSKSLSTKLTITLLSTLNMQTAIHLLQIPYITYNLKRIKGFVFNNSKQVFPVQSIALLGSSLWEKLSQDLKPLTLPQLFTCKIWVSQDCKCTMYVNIYAQFSQIKNTLPCLIVRGWVKFYFWTNFTFHLTLLGFIS